MDQPIDLYQIPPNPIFTYLNEDQIESEFKCQSLCQKPLFNPVTHTPCGVSFCEKCITQAQFLCPTCQFGSKDEYLPLRAKLVTTLLGRCLVECNNCHTQLSQNDILEHMNVCPFLCPRKWGDTINKSLFLAHDDTCLEKLVNCPNGCEGSVLRKGLEEHELVCGEKIIFCSDGCGEGIKRKEREEHGEVCPETLISCPFECGLEVKRKDLSFHDNVCLFKEVPCPAEVVGCEEKVKRKDLEEHVKGCVWHLNKEMASRFQGKIGELLKKMEDQSLKIEKLRGKIVIQNSKIEELCAEKALLKISLDEFQVSVRQEFLKPPQASQFFGIMEDVELSSLQARTLR